MRYTENFKKEVTKKALSPGVFQKDICRKLKISSNSVHEWKKKYRTEVEKEIKEIDVASILKEEEIDLDRMLREADRLEIEQQEDTEELTIDKIFSPSRKSKELKASEKSAIVTEYRKLSQGEAGSFLRRYGLNSQEIKLWEGEILAMGKKQIDKDEYIKKLEGEKKTLEKRVKNLERDKRELEFIIEIKKKYPQLFGVDEDSSSEQNTKK